MAAKQDKAERKQAKKNKRASRKERFTQIIEAFKMQRREDKALIPWLAGSFVVIAGALFGIGWAIGAPWFFLVAGVLLGVLAGMVIFGRRVQRNVYRKAEGQPGSAAWALDNLRGKWRVTQTVAATTQLDAVHRVLGAPGVILVGEGTPHRVKGLLAQEKKRVSRLVGDTPIYDLIIGNDEGQIPLRKLQRHLTKLPRNMKSDQIDTLEAKLGALGTRGAAMPKGPTPQGAKQRNMQRAARRR